MGRRKYTSVSLERSAYEEAERYAADAGFTSVAAFVTHLIKLYPLIKDLIGVSTTSEKLESLEATIKELESTINKLESRISELEIRLGDTGVTEQSGGEDGHTGAKEERGRGADAGSSDGGKQRKSRGVDRALKAFLGEIEYARVKGTPIVVRKAEIFVGGVEPSDDLGALAEKYGAAVVPEFDENENVVGVSIVPNTGFHVGFGNGVKLEDWFERYGRKLLKGLSERFREVN